MGDGMLFPTNVEFVRQRHWPYRKHTFSKGNQQISSGKFGLLVLRKQQPRRGLTMSLGAVNTDLQVKVNYCCTSRTQVCLGTCKLMTSNPDFSSGLARVFSGLYCFCFSHCKILFSPFSFY
jgi:hypothetical protein